MIRKLVLAHLFYCLWLAVSESRSADRPTDQPESWMARPHAEWPQLVLTHRAEFKGHTPLRGASAFLVVNSGGVVFCATARHLIGPSGGVEPTLREPQLDRALASWTVFPRVQPAKTAAITGLAIELGNDARWDWLFLRLARPSGELPAKPLRLRRTPVEIGEEVYLVGIPYSEASSRQNVYVGKVRQRSDNLFRYDISPAVDIRGFSGAPILDRQGAVVGVMTVWFEPRMSGGKYLEAGGEDAAEVFFSSERIR